MKLIEERIKMNKELEDYAKAFLRNNLKKCSDEEFIVFKKMYSVNKLDANIREAVDNVGKTQLTWAMQQVTNALLKKGKDIWSFRKISTNS